MRCPAQPTMSRSATTAQPSTAIAGSPAHRLLPGTAVRRNTGPGPPTLTPGTRRPPARRCPGAGPELPGTETESAPVCTRVPVHLCTPFTPANRPGPPAVGALAPVRRPNLWRAASGLLDGLRRRGRTGSEAAPHNVQPRVHVRVVGRPRGPSGRSDDDAVTPQSARTESPTTVHYLRHRTAADSGLRNGVAGVVSGVVRPDQGHVCWPGSSKGTL